MNMTKVERADSYRDIYDRDRFVSPIRVLSAWQAAAHRAN